MNRLSRRFSKNWRVLRWTNRVCLAVFVVRKWRRRCDDRHRSHWGRSCSEFCEKPFVWFDENPAGCGRSGPRRAHSAVFESYRIVENCGNHEFVQSQGGVDWRCQAGHGEFKKRPEQRSIIIIVLAFDFPLFVSVQSNPSLEWEGRRRNSLRFLYLLVGVTGGSTRTRLVCWAN